MKAPRALLVVGATVAAAAAAIASCALEGDVFTLLPDAAPPIDSSTFDATTDDGLDTADTIDDFPADQDAAFVHCFPDACDRRTSECCISGRLDPYCIPLGTCPEGGTFECDRASQCDAGRICCAQPAAFSTFGRCQTGPCTDFQYCQSTSECPSGQRCIVYGMWARCAAP